MPELTPEKQRELNARLGKQSDLSLAREFGISRQRVGELRQRKGIAVYECVTRHINVGTNITEADHRDMKKAMKKTGDKNKSEYVRGAIRQRNKTVLEG